MSDPDELQFDALTPMSDPDELQFDALTPSLGAELTGVSAQSVASALHDAPAAAASQALARQLAQLLRARSVVVLRGQDGGELVGPAQLRAIYTAVHRAMGMTCAPPVKPPTAGAAQDGNLRGACFPGYAETNVLGCAKQVRDWHGLSGWLVPTPWWEKTSCQFHHDGGFSASSPPPPALVAMGCEAAPRRGGSTLRNGNGNGNGVPFAPGATLFFSTKLAARLADAPLLERARRLVCVYTKGFGRVVEGEYPIMRPSCLVPRAPAPALARDSGQRSVTDTSTVDTSAPSSSASSSASAASASPPPAAPEFESLEHLAFGDTHVGVNPPPPAVHAQQVEED